MSSFVIARVRVISVTAVSPTFARIELTSPALSDFGMDGPSFDQRIKVVFPPDGGTLPDFEGETDQWYDAWLAIPEDKRGSMRSYTIRELRGKGTSTSVVIDFVLHTEPGKTGPAARWAAAAKVGDEVIVVGPRKGAYGGGIEFAPGDASRILLSGDETAVPAICRILADLPAEASGAAFLEVPDAEDVVEVEAPTGFDVTWLPRDHAPVGTLLIPAVIEHLGGRTTDEATDLAAAGEDAEIWETPTFSGTGDEIDLEAPAAAGIPGLYAWIAGESGVVTTIRRHLVRDLGMDRTQVAFMGYWREGVAMRG